MKFLIGAIPRTPKGENLEAVKRAVSFVKQWASPENEANVIQRFMRTHKATGMTEPMNMPELKRQLADMRQKVDKISNVNLIQGDLADNIFGARRGKNLNGMYDQASDTFVIKEGLSAENAYGVAAHEASHAWNMGILADPMSDSLFHPGYSQLAEEILGLPTLKMTESQINKHIAKGMDLALDNTPRGRKRLAAHQKVDGKLNTLFYLSVPHEIHSRTMAARAFLPWEKVQKGTVTPDDVMSAYRDLNQRDPAAAGFAFRFATGNPNKNYFQNIFTAEDAARLARWQNITPAVGLGAMAYLNTGGDA